MAVWSDNAWRRVNPVAAAVAAGEAIPVRYTPAEVRALLISEGDIARLGRRSDDARIIDMYHDGTRILDEGPLELDHVTAWQWGSIASGSGVDWVLTGGHSLPASGTLRAWDWSTIPAGQVGSDTNFTVAGDNLTLAAPIAGLGVGDRVFALGVSELDLGTDIWHTQNAGVIFDGSGMRQGQIVTPVGDEFFTILIDILGAAVPLALPPICQCEWNLWTASFNGQHGWGGYSTSPSAITGYASGNVQAGNQNRVSLWQSGFPTSWADGLDLTTLGAGGANVYPYRESAGTGTTHRLRAMQKEGAGRAVLSTTLDIAALKTFGAYMFRQHVGTGQSLLMRWSRAQIMRVI